MCHSLVNKEKLGEILGMNISVGRSGGSGRGVRGYGRLSDAGVPGGREDITRVVSGQLVYILPGVSVEFCGGCY
jgi:hypothetical protein